MRPLHPTRHRPRPLRAGVVLTCALLVLTACSGDQPDDPAPSPTSSAGTDEPEGDEGSDEGEDGSDEVAYAPPAAAVPDDVDPALTEVYRQPVDWQPCDEGECATVTVPVDYADPDGATTELALARRPAADPDRRIGSLLLNPGGPGGSGVDYLATYASQAGSLADRFDLVGFDPRGVARSDQLDCVDDETFRDLVLADPVPASSSDVDAALRRTAATGRELGEGCLDDDPLGAHVAAVDVVRDIDVLRGVLGDTELYFHGASYGTMLGSTYAATFPDRVGRMVLDGAVDPSLGSFESAAQQARGFEASLDAYLAACTEADTCSAFDSATQGRAEVEALLERLGTDPLPVDDGELGVSLATYGMVLPLYDRLTWNLLSPALADALDGDGQALADLGDAYLGAVGENGQEYLAAANCLDSPLPPLGQVRREAVALSREAPVFGPFLGWGAAVCSDWPVDPPPEPASYAARGAAPIVVIGTTGDPATPYDNAVALAETLSSGRLVTYDGEGHTAFGRGVACIDDTVRDYLGTGTPPAAGLTCS